MTAQVLKLRDYSNKSINHLIDDIHKQFANAADTSRRADRARLNAGQMLVALQKRIEAGEAGENVNWWKWYDKHFARSRRDARKVMKIAKDADPELAAEKARAANRAEKAKSREKGLTVSPPDLVTHALRLVEEMDAKQRHRFFGELRKRYADTYKDN